ncbi:hypothetical protein [Rummeliibacillus stabekisii]|uniref:Uncharacterized protein n=1 Tax=Rummeliibacillus stabekisii TaxID=241244 RepID=A0A143HAK5_9BACL|nr:hypothetical protein [Rummeliibacillus stabekisii]AMW98430.1 hypothetical protein ATY39_02675 [Rummeliibacillus stabekisii]
MNDSQKELLNKLLKMPVGTTFQKGKTKRILVGFNGFMIMYKTKATSKKTTGQDTLSFLNWVEKAEIVTE